MEERKPKTIPAKLLWLEENLMALIVFAVTILLFVSVLLRYFSSFFKLQLGITLPTISWAEEAIRYGIIWITFLAAANAFRRESHFGVDLIFRMKSAKLGKAVRLFNDICCFVFCGFVCYYGAKMVLFNLGTGQISPSMKLPFWLVYTVIPFSGGLSMLYIARNFVRKIITPAEVLHCYNNTTTEGEDK